MGKRLHGCPSGRRRTRLAAIPLLLLAVTLVMPPSASALTLNVPRDVFGKVVATASFTSKDASGIATLFVDGTPVRSVLVTDPPASVTFGAVALKPGVHAVSLVARGSDEVTETSARKVIAWRKPMPPVLVSPSTGYCAANCTILAKAGPDTTRLELQVNGKARGGRPVVAGQIVRLGTVPMRKGANSVRILASNPVATAAGSFSIKRLDFPWPTCIVVDKSDYRLYWVRDGALVKTYPVAIGKPSTPTPERVWKVGVKYVYGEWGVYGPRRLRLFKRIGPGSYEYTGYGIHGTNEEWVIGTMASHGCIRMYNRDVLELYPQVPIGTMVLTRE